MYSVNRLQNSPGAACPAFFHRAVGFPGRKDILRAGPGKTIMIIMYKVNSYHSFSGNLLF